MYNERNETPASESVLSTPFSKEPLTNFFVCVCH